MTARALHIGDRFVTVGITEQQTLILRAWELAHMDDLKKRLEGSGLTVDEIVLPEYERIVLIDDDTVVQAAIESGRARAVDPTPTEAHQPRKYQPGHFDGDGCVFPDAGHFAIIRPTACPECIQGKHSNCTHIADYELDDTPIDCKCGCPDSRTCPSCADVVPEGWTLDDHHNCNHPEDFQALAEGDAPIHTNGSQA